jgi:hypothetical protein
MKRGISDFGFRISDFPTAHSAFLVACDGKSEIRNPKSEIEWVGMWTS